MFDRGGQGRRSADRAAAQVQSSAQPQGGKALSVALPATLLARADEVIE
jgi:hypothetical protein